MELIERYLQAVKFALPGGQQDDIVKELRDSILSQVEERESDLGRRLTEDEQVEMLKKMGSPMELAGRYRQHQHLIGYSVFPVYWKVMKMALGIAFLVHAGLAIALAANGKPLTESLAVLVRYPGVALMVFAWITLVFFALEFFGTKLRINERWDPRKLPPLVKTNPRKSRVELIAQLAAQLIFGIWWLTGLHYQYLIFGPGIAFFNFGPIWLELYPLFVIMLVVDITFTAGMLFRPQWTEGRRFSRLVMSALGLLLVLVLLKTPDLFLAANSNPQTQSLANTVNTAAHLGLLVAAIVNGLNIALASIRLIGGKLSRAHQQIVGS
jgi:hypothetical protein